MTSLIIINKRIENEDVLKQFEKNRGYDVNASKTSNVFYSSQFFNKNQTKKPIYDIARDEIWKPIVWLHQKQLVDDFIFFTILSELCATFSKNIAFNVKQCFVNFIISNMPVLLTEDALKSKKYTSIGKRDKNWEQPLDIGWKMSAQSKAFIEGDGSDLTKIDGKSKLEISSKEWKYLYKNQCDKILLPAAVNNHYEYFKLYVDWGSDVNIQDFQGWTALH
mmetsp:Transcript_24550/g.21788  ORF Transcript_24550/g.21788 Transcript_24550/m.21788 type:complete len:221 (+) Transcript_24550:61-723(+)